MCDAGQLAGAEHCPGPSAAEGVRWWMVRGRRGLSQATRRKPIGGRLLATRSVRSSHGADAADRDGRGRPDGPAARRATPDVVRRPRVCLIPTASDDSEQTSRASIARSHNSTASRPTSPSSTAPSGTWKSSPLARPGARRRGITANLLAVGAPRPRPGPTARTARRRCRSGISAGTNCWFEQSLTHSSTLSTLRR